MSEHQSDWLTLSQAARSTPGRPSASTLWRWIRDGVRTGTGERLHLRHRRVGRRIFVLVQDLDLFFKTVAERDWAPARSERPSRTTKDSRATFPREKKIEDSDRYCDNVGL